MQYEKMVNKYWIWLSRIEKLTSVKKEKLLSIFKAPQVIWNLKEKDLIKIEGLSSEEIKEILNKCYRDNLEKYVEYLIKNKISIITLNDKLYPDNLRKIYDKPIMLFAKGNLELLNKKGIAIVGSRECSQYGKNVSRKLAYNLAQNNICIISGLARGIDKYAHIGALDANGKTIAVIGNGLDIVYPYENKKLFERIVENKGLIVTEYVVGTRPNKINFPARNRIISGISEGIAVVEAREKSGALITVDFGLEQGKEIYAVPGNIDEETSKGTNELIKQGANILTTYEDIIKTQNF